MSEPYVAVSRALTPELCFEHALVLEALGFDYEMRAEEQGLLLAVAPAEVTRARRELELYRRENVPVAAAPATPLAGGGAAGVVAYIATLLTVAYLDAHGSLGRDWFAAGRLDAGAVRDGQWWRTLTALTLHVDVAHLFGNLTFGTLFGLAAGQVLGCGVAWFSILAAGALGNALNAFLQPPSHTSAGASTAVFAALGILGAYIWRSHPPQRARWANRWAPIIAGVVLLAFLGVGDERTDIVAHLTGWLCGALAGLGWGILGARKPRPSLQAAFGSGAVVLLAGAWILALRAAGD